MGAAKNLSGRRFGKLVVTNHVESIWRADRKRRFWRCKCDCGEITNIEASSLTHGNSTACKTCCRITHGKTKSKTYRIWATMLSRCRDKNNDGYYLYGGRGIKVCKRWLKYENFLADMGECHNGLSIDRIDNGKNYEPGNCKWSTPKEQAQNRRDNKLSFDKADEIRNLFNSGMIKADIARKFEVSFSAVCRVVDGTRWVRKQL